MLAHRRAIPASSSLMGETDDVDSPDRGEAARITHQLPNSG